MRRFGALFICFLVCGCAAYTLVAPARVDVGGAFSVEPQKEWNKLGELLVSGPVEVWTSDGQQLDTIFFFTGVAGDQPLFEKLAGVQPLQPGRQPTQTTDMPVFRADMPPTEIAELFDATMSRMTRSTLSGVTNLQPATFAGTPGFRFDFAYTTQDQLERKGFAVGTVKDKKLYMIFYQGTRIYHFGKHLKEAERIVSSARFP